MATATATAGIGALTGEIKFSQLRRTFLKMKARATFADSETFDPETGSVSASQLLRDTTGDNPNVPDATENAAIATTNDWKPSQFNNALKYYYAQQTGNEEDYNIGSQSWNSNLPLSIRKFMFIDGRCEATGPTTAACQLTTTSRNVRIDVSGEIYGANGTPGEQGGVFTGDPNLRNGGPGGKGGTSLEVNASANNIVVFVRSTAEIFAGGGGGGGGGKGGDGGQGGSGSFSFACGTGCIHYGGYCGGCPPSLRTEWCGGNCGTHKHPRIFCSCCWPHTIYCSGSSPGEAGGAGGNGGAGGKGRGWNNTSNALDGPTNGVAGSTGAAGSPASSGGGAGGDGGTGGTGGNGGQHGDPGIAGTDGLDGETGDNGNTGSGSAGVAGGLGGPGGAAGDALSGADYSYTGTINTSGTDITIDGLIVGGTQI